MPFYECRIKNLIKFRSSRQHSLNALLNSIRKVPYRLTRLVVHTYKNLFSKAREKNIANKDDFWEQIRNIISAFGLRYNFLILQTNFKKTIRTGIFHQNIILQKLISIFRLRNEFILIDKTSYVFKVWTYANLMNC